MALLTDNDVKPFIQDSPISAPFLKGLNLSPELLTLWKSGHATTGLHRGRLALAVDDGAGQIAGFIGLSLKPTIHQSPHRMGLISKLNPPPHAPGSSASAAMWQFPGTRSE